MMLKYFLGAVIIMLTGFGASAQTQDTVVRKPADTVIVAPPKKTDDAGQRFVPKIKKEKEYHPDSTHSPKLAVKRSLIIPGWGQWYNRKGAWWKIPAIYGGLGALGYSIVTSQQGYNKFLALSRIRNLGVLPKEGDELYPVYKKYQADYELYSRSPLATLQDAASNYQRNFQISILGVIAVWGIQAVEAYVEAKFISSFSVDNDLSIKVGPGFINQQPTYAMLGSANAYIPGIKITFTLK